MKNQEKPGYQKKSREIKEKSQKCRPVERGVVNPSTPISHKRETSSYRRMVRCGQVEREPVKWELVERGLLKRGTVKRGLH